MSISTQPPRFETSSSSRFVASCTKFIARSPGPAVKTIVWPDGMCSTAFVPSRNCISQRSGWPLAFLIKVPWDSLWRAPSAEASIPARPSGKRPLVMLFAYSMSFSPRTKLQSAVAPRFKRLIVTCAQPTALAIFISEMPRSSRAWTASAGVMLLVPLFSVWAKITRLACRSTSYDDLTSWPQLSGVAP